MAIHVPERAWWKPLSKDERIWIGLALAWMIISFLFMPIYHVTGSQNAPAETYSVSADDYSALVEGMVEKYKVGEEKGIPVVRPPAGDNVYLKASMWQWYPILELEKGKTYRLHLSSVDVQHGFSLLPVNMNLMVLPGYDYVATVTPTKEGEYTLVCNEFCGPGHHLMVGKLYVK